VGTIDIFSKNRVTGSALSSSWGSTPGGYNADNAPEKHFTAVPNGSYTISPSSGSAGTLYALGGVSTDVASAEQKKSDSWLSSLPSYFTSLARAAVTVSSEVNCDPPSNLNCPSVPNQSVTTADPNITFNIVWDPLAVLGRSPSTLNLSGQLGTDTTVSGTVTVNNNGGAPGSQLNWTATDNQPWLSLSSSGGQLARGASGNFQAIANIVGLAPGNYTGTITITGLSQLFPTSRGEHPSVQSATATVNLTVIEARDYTISISPSSIARPLGIAANYNLSVTCQGGYNGNIGNFQFNPVPSATTIFVNGTGILGCGESTTVTMYSSQSSLPGSYTFTVTGNPSLPVVHTIPDPTATLVIETVAPLNADNSQCEQIRLSWNQVTGETGYRIYRANFSGSPPVYPTDYVVVTTTGANATSYTDVTPPLARGQSYYYAVSARYPGGFGGTGSFPAFAGPLVNRACIPQPTGEIEITAVNGNNVPNGTVPRIKNGDTVTWEITIRNRPLLASATLYDVNVDTLMTSNLEYDGGEDLNGSNGSCNAITVSSNAGNRSFSGDQELSDQHVIFDANSDMGDKCLSNSDWTLDFDAVVSSASIQPVDFIQDTAVVTGYYPQGSATPCPTCSVTLRSPIYVVQMGTLKIPQIIEVAP